MLARAAGIALRILPITIMKLHIPRRTSVLSPETTEEQLPPIMDDFTAI